MALCETGRFSLVLGMEGKVLIFLINGIKYKFNKASRLF